MKYLFLFFIAFVFLSAGAQNPMVKQWDYRFGGSKQEGLNSLLQTADGGFLLAGGSASDSSGDKTQHAWGDTSQPYFDYWIVKLDSAGGKQWDKRFGGVGSDELWAAEQTTDGGYILGGYSNSDTSGDKTQPYWSYWGDFWVVKIDSTGTKQWDKRYGGFKADGLTSLQQTLDGGYILGGNSGSGAGGDKTESLWGNDFYMTDYWVVKIDSAGNKQWDRRFGGLERELLFTVKQTRDKGYILAGYSGSDSSGNKTQNQFGGLDPMDLWVVKVDSAGNKQWDKSYGGTGQDLDGRIILTSDGGYLLGATSYSGVGGTKTDTCRGNTDYWIVKLDSLGNSQWDKTFGGSSSELLFSLQQTKDKGYLISGVSDSPASSEKTENNDAPGYAESWIIKTDSLGNKQWDKTIFTTSPLSDYSGYAIETREGCYVIANCTIADTGGYKTQFSRGAQDNWVVKFCDCEHSAIRPVPVNLLGDTIICSSDSTIICPDASFMHYEWNTGATTPCLSTSLAGNYYLTAIDNNTCTVSSGHLSINVLPQPQVSISVSGDTLIAYHANTYQWYLNDTPIAGASGSIYIIDQGGSYTVAITDTNGCNAVSNAIIVLGVKDLSRNYISVTPNPFTTNISIALPKENFSQATFTITNIIGQPVYTKHENNLSSTYTKTLDLSYLPNGIYFLEVIADGERSVKEVVKQ